MARAKNPVSHRRTKHIKIKYYFIREAKKEKEVVLLHCYSKDQITDIFKTALPIARFEQLMKKLVVCNKLVKNEC